MSFFGNTVLFCWENLSSRYLGLTLRITVATPDSLNYGGLCDQFSSSIRDLLRVFFHRSDSEESISSSLWNILEPKFSQAFGPLDFAAELISRCLSRHRWHQDVLVSRSSFLTWKWTENEDLSSYMFFSRTKTWNLISRVWSTVDSFLPIVFVCFFAIVLGLSSTDRRQPLLSLPRGGKRSVSQATWTGGDRWKITNVSSCHCHSPKTFKKHFGLWLKGLQFATGKNETVILIKDL